MRDFGGFRSLLTGFFAFLIVYSASGQLASITAPENYTVSIENGQTTYRNPSAGAVIQLLVIPDKGFDAFINDFSSDQLQKNGLVAESKDTVYLDGTISAIWYKGWLDLTAADNSGKITRYTRMIYFTGNEQQTVMAVVTFPSIADVVMIEPMLLSLSTIKW